MKSRSGFRIPVSIPEGIDDFLDVLRSEGRSKKTLKKYRTVLRRFCVYLISCGIDCISDLVPSLLVNYRRARKGKCSESTRYHDAITIKQWTKHMTLMRYIVEDPFVGVKICKPIVDRRYCFSEKEVTDIIEISLPPYRQMFTIFPYSGLRMNELRELSWDMVDMKSRRIRLKKEKMMHRRKANRRARVIPMHIKVERAFEQLPRTDQYVFASKKGNLIGETTINRHLKRALKSLGIEEGVTHSFRHFFGTYFANKGVPPFQLASWMGHQDVNMVMHYYHNDEQASDLIMTKISRGDT